MIPALPVLCTKNDLTKHKHYDNIIALRPHILLVENLSGKWIGIQSAYRQLTVTVANLATNLEGGLNWPDTFC